MFGSNSPADRLSLSYLMGWNVLKKMITVFSPDKHDAMLRDRTARVYRL
jgi:predicted TIM-barrel fold metal-dependent hydrolase